MPSSKDMQSQDLWKSPQWTVTILYIFFIKRYLINFQTIEIAWTLVIIVK